MHKLIASIATCLFLLSSPLFARGDEADTELGYSVLYSDAEGVTHFRDEYLPWKKSSSGSATTPLEDAEQIGFVRAPAGIRSDWHPAPRKQFVLVLKGVMEVEAGDGERRKFTSGRVLVVADTEGRGHRTNILGDLRGFG